MFGLHVGTGSPVLSCRWEESILSAVVREGADCDGVGDDGGFGGVRGGGTNSLIHCHKYT